MIRNRRNRNRNVWRAIAFVIVIALAVVAGIIVEASEQSPRPAQAQTQQPNIVYVLADDMRADEIEYMPQTRALLGDGGTTFSNSFVTTSLCCPSRTSALRGQYVHNHGVYSNNAADHGALSQFNQNHLADSTVATWLDGAGYYTALYGKYLNGCNPCAKPPGWDDWSTGQYSPAFVFDKAESFVTQNQSSGQPFFLYLAPHSPHTPLKWSNQYDGYYADAAVPRTTSINETDVSDKPRYVRNNSKKNMSDQDQSRRGRARMLLELDDHIAQLAQQLEDAGQWDNTVLVFTSDNGYMQGEHRLDKKRVPYEESIKVPLLIRGPGIQQGVTRDEIALNIDYAPTFAELGRAASASFVDGRSLMPILHGESVPWRDRFGIESYSMRDQDMPMFYGVRTLNEKFVQYRSNEQEYYNLTNDPYELNSDASKAGALPTSAAQINQCAGESCRIADMSGSTQELRAIDWLRNKKKGK